MWFQRNSKYYFIWLPSELDLRAQVVHVVCQISMNLSIQHGYAIQYVEESLVKNPFDGRLNLLPVSC